MNNRVKNIILIVLVIGLLSMSIAYAILSQNLDVSSRATVKGSTWDIHFENLSDVSTIGNAKVNSNPILGITSITELKALLTDTGDEVSYTFDVVNNGTIDAVISDYIINKAGNGIVCTDSFGSTNSQNATAVCSNLDFKLTYASTTTSNQTNTIIEEGTQVQKGQQLNHHQSIKLKLTLSYSGSSYSSRDIYISGLDAIITYSQK